MRVACAIRLPCKCWLYQCVVDSLPIPLSLVHPRWLYKGSPFVVFWKMNFNPSIKYDTMLQLPVFKEEDIVKDPEQLETTMSNESIMASPMGTRMDEMCSCSFSITLMTHKPFIMRKWSSTQGSTIFAWVRTRDFGSPLSDLSLGLPSCQWAASCCPRHGVVKRGKSCRFGQLTMPKFWPIWPRRQTAREQSCLQRSRNHKTTLPPIRLPYRRAARKKHEKGSG